DGAPDGSVSQETLQLPAIEIAHDYMVVERLGFGRLPQKIWCCCIGATIHLVCHSEGAARNSPIVVSRASCGSTEDDQSGHVNAEHISAVTSNCPNQGWPRRWPAASTRPCAGGYMDAYVGCWIMWKLSKCIHIGWGGLVRRP